MLILFTSFLTSGNLSTAFAASNPSVIFSASTVKLDYNRCATVTVTGIDFTPSTFTANYATFSAVDQKGNSLAVFPTQTAILGGGNFVRLLSVCNIIPPTIVTFIIVDKATGRIATQAGSSTAAARAAKTTNDANPASASPSIPNLPTLTVIAPNPTISVLSQQVGLIGGCAPVTVFGTNFVPSTTGANYAYIYADLLGRPETLSGSPAHVPVLGGGNITFTAFYCGLRSHDTFRMVALDNASLLFSNNIVMTVL